MNISSNHNNLRIISNIHFSILFRFVMNLYFLSIPLRDRAKAIPSSFEEEKTAS